MRSFGTGSTTGVTALIAGLAAAVFFAGCAAVGSPSDGTGPAGPKVNKVIIGVNAPSTEGNAPGRDFSSPPSYQIRPMYEYLVGLDPRTGGFINQLDESWALEPDGKSWRFKLRKGVKFHGNWGDFTAKDVVHSHWDITQEDSLHGNSAFFRNAVDTIEAVNDYELIFRLKAPNADFLNLLSELVGGMEIQSKAHFDTLGRPPTLTEQPIAGTGPYQFKERAQGAFIRFDRVPYHQWRTMPDFPELELRWINEASTRLAALLTGEIHVAPLPEDLQASAERQGMKVAKGNVPALRTFLLFLCCYLNDVRDQSKGYTHPDSPLLDIRVRQALNKAINRDELNKQLFGGKGEGMAMNGFHPKSGLGWNADWERRFKDLYGYDTNRSRALLAEAGYGPGKPLRTNLIVSKLPPVPQAEDVIEAVSNYWRAVGVDVQLVTMDATQLSARRRGLDFDNHTEIRDTSAHQLLGFQVYKSGLHGLRGNSFEIAELNDIFARTRTELDLEKQGRLWKELGEKAFPAFQDVPLFWLPAEAVVNPNVIADYVFPGSISGTWTHLELLKAAR